MLPNRIRTRNISPASVAAALARLLQKIYEVDPLRCPHCGSEMQIIAWIEQPAVTRKILSASECVGAATTFSPAQAVPSQALKPLWLLSPRQAQQIRASTDSVFWDDVPVWNG